MKRRAKHFGLLIAGAIRCAHAACDHGCAQPGDGRRSLGRESLIEVIACMQDTLLALMLLWRAVVIYSDFRLNSLLNL
jgi:hypothetical protein